MTQQRQEKNRETSIVIDTSVWIEYFRGKNTFIIEEVEKAIDEKRVVSLPIILAELLRGCLTKNEVKIVRETIGKIPSYPLKEDFWEKVGLFCFQLARKGFTSGLIDAYIALATLESGSQLFTLDKDFQKIARLSPLQLFK